MGVVFVLMCAVIVVISGADIEKLKDFRDDSDLFV